MSDYIKEQILGIADNFRALAVLSGDIETVARVCTDTLRAGNKIMFWAMAGLPRIPSTWPRSWWDATS